MFVKICGITNEDDEDAAINAGADFLGFVVDVPSSPRNIPVLKAKHLVDRLPSRLNSVAVTRFSSIDSLRQLFTELRPNYLQLHGGLGQLLPQLSDITDHMIIAVNGEAQDASETAAAASRSFQFILVDSANNTGLGGTGRIHDWYSSSRIRDQIYPAHLFLAGGLTPQNVAEAVKIVGPFGVDVSTGVERKPGFKDPEMMREFVARAKGENI
jgi:phosphoribosylanthranilate isomerase